MYAKVQIDILQAVRTTENDDVDEVYLVLGGVDAKGNAVSKPRISPTGDDDYYGLDDGEQVNDIAIWKGHIADGESVVLTLLVMEQDGNTWGIITGFAEAIAGIASSVAAIVASAGALTPILASTGTAATSVHGIANAIDNFDAESAHQVIGSFLLTLLNREGHLDFACTPLNSANVTLDGYRATIVCNGHDSHYNVSLSVHSLAPVRIRNQASGLCLDVENGNPADGTGIQQYSCHGQATQRWFLVERGPMNLLGFNEWASLMYRYAFSFIVNGPYEIVSDLSGKTLEVEGNSSIEGANIKQYVPHGGTNQLWLVLTDRQKRDAKAIINIHSGLCLGIEGNSNHIGAEVQQFKYTRAEHTRQWLIE